MTFWPKVWGSGNSHPGEQQIAPLESIGSPPGYRLASGAGEGPPHTHDYGSAHNEPVAPYLSSVDPGSRTDVSGEFRHITLTEDQPRRVRYEFFTSDHIQDNLRTYGRSDANNPGSATRVQLGGRRARPLPLFSSTFAPPIGPDGKAKWTQVPVDFIEGPDYPDPPLIAWGASQGPKFFEYITWPRNGKDSMVSSVQAQAPGWNSQCNWQSARATTRLANANILVSDYGLDVKPTYYDATGSSAGAPQLENDRVWWRRATVQKSGGRRFFVSTDNFGRFQVYPVKDYLASDIPYDAIPADHFQQYMPPYPDWVTVPDVEDATVYNNQWLWAFSADGTRAVTCPFHSTAGTFFKYRDGSPRNWLGAILPSDRTLIADWLANTINAREDIPGLVEIGIEITVTGPGDMDFEAAFTILRDEYSGTGGRFVFDSAYSLPDVDKTMGVEADTLITSSIVCYCPPGEYQAGPVNVTDNDDSLVETVNGITNLESFLLIEANEDAGPRELLRVPLVIGGGDMRFLTMNGYETARAVAPSSKYMPGGTGSNLPLAAGGTAFFPPMSPVAYGPSIYSDTDPTNRATRRAEIGALELRTLSLVYLENDYFTGLGKAVVKVYGKDEINEQWALDGGARPPRVYPPATQLVPTTATDIYQWVLFSQLATDWGCGFSINPAGHWSLCANGNVRTWLAPGRLDIVQPRRGDRFKHGDLFNEAFEQTRSELFYWTDDFPGKGFWDRGSFRTNGVWITF